MPEIVRNTQRTDERQPGAPAILVASFGTSYNGNRCLTVGAIESSVRERYPDLRVRRAFTSSVIARKLAARDGIRIDGPDQAAERLLAGGARRLAVLPTHLTAGEEYAKLKRMLEPYARDFDGIVLADPLLSCESGCSAVAEALAAHLAPFDDGRTAICLVGHGNERTSNESYARIQRCLAAQGRSTWFVAAVEGSPGCDELIGAVRRRGLDRALLHPLMVVAGDHANRDMADRADPGSWVSRMERAGIRTDCMLEGLGQIYGVHLVYLEHLARALDALG